MFRQIVLPPALPLHTDRIASRFGAGLVHPDCRQPIGEGVRRACLLDAGHTSDEQLPTLASRQTDAVDVEASQQQISVLLTTGKIAKLGLTTQRDRGALADELVHRQVFRGGERRAGDGASKWLASSLASSESLSRPEISVRISFSWFRNRQEAELRQRSIRACHFCSTDATRWLSIVATDKISPNTMRILQAVMTRYLLHHR